MNNLKNLSCFIALNLLINPFLYAQSSPPAPAKSIAEIAKELEPGEPVPEPPACSHSEIYECVITKTEEVTYGNGSKHCEATIGFPDLSKLKPCKGCEKEPEIPFNQCTGAGRISFPMANLGKCTPENMMGTVIIGGKKISPWPQPRPKFAITCKEPAKATPVPVQTAVATY